MTRWQRPARKHDDGIPMGKVRLEYISEKALKVEFLETTPNNEIDQWVPKSQLHADSEIDDTTLIGEEGELRVSTWIFEQKGWTR